MNQSPQAMTSLQVMTLPVGSLESYLHRVNQIPMLTLEEEQAYAKALHEDGDVEAARQLVLAHLRYVAQISNA